MRRKLAAFCTALTAALAMTAVSPLTSHAENPICQTAFTPDPAPVVYGDELWVYTGRDRDGENDFYYMTGYHALSTTDMKNWTNHGCFMEDTDFKWAGENDAWASQCIERNGKYYFYFTTTNNTGGGRAIGVGVADDPAGPFKDVLGKPLCGPNWDYIDPTVMIDDDGQAWLMFGNPKCYYVKLKEDMVTLDGPIQQFDMTEGAFGNGKNGTAYGEGPWITKHGNLYYLVYASFFGSDGGESMCYSTGPSVTGPWTFRGQIMKSHNCFTTHGGIIDYKDHSYFFYHKNGLPGGGTFNRSACVEEFTYKADGTIPMLSPTNDGPEQLEAFDPFRHVEAETGSWFSGVKVEPAGNGSQAVGYIEKGDYIKVSGVDFGDGADSFKVSASSATEGGTLELHIDEVNGPVIGACKITGTGGWKDFEEFSCDVKASGEHDLFLVFNGGSGSLYNLDWWQFSGAGSTEVPEPDGYLFHDTFERGTNSWTGRGSASVASSDKEAYEGSKALLCSGRESEWHGAIRNLNASTFKAGQEYSFSVNVTYTDGAPTNSFKLQIEYTDADGEGQFSNIAKGTCAKGEWIQLANTNYKIPAGATNVKFYVETEDSTTNFYVDDAIGAVAGTVIEGAGKGSAREIVKGDVNGDGVIDVYDLAAAKRGILKGFPNRFDELSADVDESGTADLTDVVALQKWMLKKIKAFPVVEKPTEPPTEPSAMRTISVYTPVVEKQMVTAEPADSKTNKAGVNYGTLEKKSYFSKFCGREKKYNVLLPAGYSKDKKYPVLYVMHGYWENQDRMIIEGNGTMYTQQIIGNAIAEGAAKEMIVVFPYIYSSQTQNDCSAMDDANNVAYDNFDTVLTTELMPLIEQNYSVATGRENTAITGFSMGGRESLNIGMKHPDLFGYVGAICPAPGASGAWKFASEEAAPSLILITAGGNDTVVYTTPNGYHDNFTKNNVPHIWHYYEAGYHGDNSIHAHIYNFVRAIFKA